MNFREQFLVKPGTRVRLSDFDPGFAGKEGFETDAVKDTQKYVDKLRKLQFLLYAEKKHSLLIVLQALDAGGKDGTVNHVMSAMNPQGTTVTGFKQPSSEDLNHDFLWRVHPHVPGKGAVAIFNRSHYEDVLVVRVHRLAPKTVWSERYELINNFEKLLRRQNDTHIIKFFLHISKEEQLERFKQRLNDPNRNWKISDSDYRDREYWDAYTKAFEQVFAKTSKKDAPWYIIPSNHKWFRNLALSQIVAETMEDIGMQMPKPQVDLEVIRKQYHQAAEQGKKEKRGKKGTSERKGKGGEK
jgi:PPK2 family polyphosphate:nucleotide phosphotransferase